MSAAHIERVETPPRGAVRLSRLGIPRSLPMDRYVHALHQLGYRLVQCRQQTFAVRIH